MESTKQITDRWNVQNQIKIGACNRTILERLHGQTHDEINDAFMHEVEESNMDMN